MLKFSGWIPALLLFAGMPLQAQQSAPSLQIVLREGLAATQALAKREADAKDGASEMFLARGLLTFALLRADQRDAVDELFSGDAADQSEIVKISEALLVELTGEVPEISKELTPTAETFHRQQISLALARRGDYEKANEQIEAFPKDAKLASVAIRSYQYIAERQLERQEIPGARKTIRRLWSRIRDLDDQDPLRKANWIIRLARLTSRAGEPGPAESLCLKADAMLGAARQAPDADLNSVSDAMRSLSVAHAMSGNPARARELLALCERDADSIQTPQETSQLRFDLEMAHAQVAHWSGQKDAALDAYGRARKFAQDSYRSWLEAEKKPLDLDEFIAGMELIMLATRFRDVALGQLEEGDREAALKTWEEMPNCLQKPATLVKLAEKLHGRGATAEARELAARCAELDRGDGGPEQLVTITAFVANIHRAAGDPQAARAALKPLAADPRVQASPDALKMTAAELVDFQAFEQAYSTIQSIESPADRALPLAKLAEGLVKAGHR